jgi:hypothetical protein
VLVPSAPGTWAVPAPPQLHSWRDRPVRGSKALGPVAEPRVELPWPRRSDKRPLAHVVTDNIHAIAREPLLSALYLPMFIIG